jgi:hypothetical protein
MRALGVSVGFAALSAAWACGGVPSGLESESGESESGGVLLCPQGGRRVVFAYLDELGQSRIRVFVDLDGDGLALTPGESFDYPSPGFDQLRRVAWTSQSKLVAVDGSSVFRGQLDASFGSLQWTEVGTLPDAEAGNEFLAGWVNDGLEGDGEAWALFDLPWTPQLVELGASGLELRATLEPGILGDGPKWFTRVGERWVVSDTDAGLVWSFDALFADPITLVDTQAPGWMAAGWAGQPQTVVSLGNEFWAMQDAGESAFVYTLGDADHSGSIDPEDEVQLLVEPGVCHRARPGHLAAFGERVLWVDDCEGTLIQDQYGEVTEQRYFSLPGALLIHPDATSLGISAWNAPCVD